MDSSYNTWIHHTTHTHKIQNLKRIHSLPGSLNVKIMALKCSMYLLPKNQECLPKKKKSQKQKRRKV
jgi:hypothetical protein